jgi:hypothetical protein
MDFCRQARARGLRLGYWPIAITLESGGAFGGAEWGVAYQRYLGKWSG